MAVVIRIDVTPDGRERFQEATDRMGMTYIASLDGTGLDLMRQFKRLQSAPAIAISGYGQDADIQASLNAGFFKHLTKPTNLAALFQAVRDARAASDG